MDSYPVVSMSLNRLYKILFIIILNLFIVFSVWADSKKNSLMIRVAIVEHAKRISLYIPGDYVGVAPHTDRVILPAGKKLNTLITPTYFGIKLDDKEYKIFGIKFRPLSKKIFFINDIPYKGEVVILRDRNKKLLAINYLKLSDYLKGVLYNEVSHWWPMEALKAQAIAARTFAIYNCIQNQDKEYDVTSTVASQVYRGSNSERFRTNLAINSTVNKVLIYKGEIIPSFYHACSGGYTEDSQNVWGIDLPVLNGVVDNFSKNSPYFNWNIEISSFDITKKFQDSGYNIGKILNISIINRSSSGRIKNMYIIGAERDILITGEKFRKIMGYSVIKSTNFKIKEKGGNYIFKGHGWGHGVGMSQWGAYYMARQGYNYEQILKYYYPGVEIQTLHYRHQTSDYRLQTE